MLTHEGLGEEMDGKLQQLSDAEIGQLIVTSAKQLRFGNVNEHGYSERRELHRRIVQHCLDLLAERGRG